MIKTILALTAMLLSGAALAAHEEQKPTETSVRAGPAQLSDAMKPLSFFAGKWEVEQQIKAHGQEAPQVSHGTFNVESDMGGKALAGHFESDLKAGDKFYGHMLVTADKAPAEKAAGAEQKFAFFWADSEGITSLTHDAIFKDNQLTITAVDFFGANRGKARITYTKTSDDRIEFSMDAEKAGGWETQISATYRRIGG